MQRLAMSAAVAAIVGMASASGAFAQAAPAAKDVVLASLAPAAQNAPAANQARPDAMVVSVLVEGAYGMLTPRSTEAAFATGERFRIKLLAPRDGEVLIYNTNPLGQTNQNPVWKTQVKAGVESITDLMQLAGNRGEDQLHIVLQPRTPPADPFAWFRNLFASKDGAAGSSSKDIRLVSESTPQSTYFYNPNGQGGYVTIRIRHQ